MALSRFKSILDTISTVMVIVAAGLFIWTMAGNRTARPTQSQVEAVTGLRIEARHVQKSLGKGAVALVEFSDFQCPYCRTFAAQAWPELRKEWIDTGRARYVTFHFPLEQVHPLALGASEAAECAARQGKFWDMREQLFDRSNALTQSELIGSAERLGLEPKVFTDCLLSNETREMVRTGQEEGKRLGVAATPTFFTGIVQADGSIQLINRIRGGDAESLSRQLAAVPVQVSLRMR